jgi:predicted dehydrogenase
MRIGVVGAGFIGAIHLGAYANMPEVEVVGVADALPQIAAAGAAIVGARAYSSYEDLITAEEVDVVDVCLPTAYHRDLALKAAKEGKHVILEKPIARNLEDAKMIIEAFDGNSKRLFVGHVVRFFPEYARIKEMIDAGELGVARTSRRSPFLTGWNDWYADWRMSGGVLLDLVIHDFDFLRWALGEVERVYARGVLGREYNRLDYALVTLRFGSGAIAHVEGQWGYPGPFNYSIEVAGSRAMVVADSAELEPVRLFGGANDPGESSDVIDVIVGKSPFQTELEHFIHCAATGEEPIVDARDAYEALRIGHAAIESVKTGRPVVPGGVR